MSQSLKVCGVSAIAPLPGDPSEALSVYANTSRDGVKVTWTFPAINSHSIAFYQVYRGVDDNAANAQLLVATAASEYYDIVEEEEWGNTYYYWVVHTSINGTVSTYNGPAIAIAGNWVAKIIDGISGEIKASDLATSLRSEIASIPSLRTGLLNETTGRLEAIEDLTFDLSNFGLSVGQTHNAILNESEQRSNELEQFATQIESITVSNGQALATISAETTARVTALGAEAAARELLATQTEENKALIQSETTARTSAISAEAEARESLAVQTNANKALIETEITTRTNAVSAEAEAREALSVRVDVTENDISATASNLSEAEQALAQAKLDLIAAEDQILFLESDLADVEEQVVVAEADIIEERTLRANADGAIATDLTELATVSINAFRQNSPPTAGQGRKFGSLWTDTDNDNVTTQWNGNAWVPLENRVALDAFAAVQTIQNSISDGEFASASSVTTLEASVSVAGGDVYDRITGVDTKAGNALTQSAPDTIDARIENKLVAQVGFCLINGAPDSSYDNQTDCEAQSGATWVPLAALAEVVRGIEINTAKGGTVKIQDRMQAYDTGLEDVEDLADGLKAEYTLKIDADPNGTGDNIIGGFGLALDENDKISAGFNVDKFWVGNVGDTYDSETLPFFIQGGNTYINSAFIAEASIGVAQIIDLSVSVAKIQDLAVTTAKIDNLAVKEANIDNLAVTNAKIEDLAVTGAKIDNATIKSANIGIGEIETANIDTAAIKEAQIDNLAVTNAKIANLAIDAAKIQNGAIENAKIGNEIRSTAFSSGSYGWRILKSGEAEFNSIKTTRANRVAFGTWTNPNTAWHFTKIGSGNNDSDWNNQSYTIADVDTGYNGDSVVQNLINKPLIARAVISTTSFSSTNSSATGTIYTVQCTASIRIRYNAVVNGSSGPVPDGRISIDFLVPLPQNRFNSVYRIRITSIKWSLIQVN